MSYFPETGMAILPTSIVSDTQKSFKQTRYAPLSRTPTLRSPRGDRLEIRVRGAY